MSRARHIIFLVLVAFLAEASRAAPTVSVLFVGNSLTEANNLPGVFQQFAAKSELAVPVTVCAITPGGALFYDHWKKGEAVAALRDRHPDFLVLQGQSTEPLFATQSFYYYGALFKAEADRVQTKTVLFSTWARPAADAYYKQATSGGSPAEMQARLNTAYGSLATTLGARLAPIGRAWQRAQIDAPAIELLDGSQHPSVAGTYLAAAVLFRTLFDYSNASSTYYGGLSKENALALQRIASAVSLSQN
jgi:hypothetical protein